MATIPPPPDEPAAPAAPERGPTPTGPSSKATIVAIVASVAVIAVIGTVLALANSGNDQSGASPSAGSTVIPVAQPAKVAAHASAFRVVLTWTAGEGTPAVRYLVSRNGSVAATLNPDQTRWVDDQVLPESTYSYAVAAVGPDGASATGRATAKTTTAPLTTAPLDGIFNVHIHATSHYGFSNFGSGNGDLGWRFAPNCAHGPCDTQLADLHRKDFRLTLSRNGVSYHGDVTLQAQVRCGGTSVSSTITITIHVTDAGVVHEHWVATRVEGTMSQFEPAQLGCVSSGATFDVAGRIVH